MSRAVLPFALFLGLAAVTFGGRAHARVFDYKDSLLAPYMRATGGLSSLNQDAFAGTTGAGTSVDGSSRWDYGGELGLMLAFTPAFHLRVGAELLQHRPVADAKGTNAGGTELFTLNSSVSILTPTRLLSSYFGPRGLCATIFSPARAWPT
ncbi:MAG: hypothetical protein HC902_02325 [Calothrix sp. SM1_5_4]|nr:hypothetical protein [Calothrix sp. SM1_5_4]